MKGRKPFHLFASVEEELAAPSAFWWRRKPEERLQYLHPGNTLEYRDAAMNAPMVRCYGWHKLGEEHDSRNVVYF